MSQSQIGQMALQMSNRPSGSLPSNTEQNPRGVNAIMLRSGKEVETAAQEVEITAQEAHNKQEVHKEQEEEKKDKGKQKEEEPKPKPPAVKPYVPPIPFPGRLKQQQLDSQFSKFLDVFKKLQINIPFAEALQQMSSYAKFMKELLTKKRRMDGNDPVMLTGECSMILQKELPHLPQK